MNAPIPFNWNGEAMVPQVRFTRQCDKLFAVGEVYPLVVHEDRSTNSHNHYFASVHEAWKNIPERLTRRYKTSEHLRKWALIKAGYADERSIACPTAEEALSVAAFIKPMDDYAIVVVADATIKVFTAKSQSARSMDKKTFQESKQAVLDIVAELIGVDAATLSANAQSNSSQPTVPPSRPQVATEPAPADAPSETGAGTTSSLEADVGNAPASDPQQASEPGNPALDGSAGLPPGFLKIYAKGLGAATNKPKSLQNCHDKVLPTLGGEPSEDDLTELRAVYGLFKRHLAGDMSGEDLAAQLRELNAI